MLLVALLTVVVCCSCNKPEDDREMFDLLYSSEFELGIRFGMVPSEVHEQLGQPLGNVSRQGGANIEEYYQPEQYEERSDLAPELSLTFINNKLTRLDNRYFPEAEEVEFPPFIFEPMSGVKLGLRKSDFVTALGDFETGPAGSLWRFVSQDRSTITIRATFTDIETLGDSLCSRLVIAVTEPVEAPRGEEIEKKQKK